MNNYRYENTIITEAGLKYIGHFGCSEVSICGDCWGIVIPISRIPEFMDKVFPDINTEDGFMIHNLKGKYCQLVLDPEKLDHIIGICNILKKSLVYFIKGEVSNENN